MITKQQFSERVDEINVDEDNLLSSIMYAAEEFEIEIEQVRNFMTEDLLIRLTEDAENLNLIEKGTSSVEQNWFV